MTRITLAGTQPNDPVLTNMFMFQRKMHKNTNNHLSGNERLSVNDCFLRNMQKYKYIANIDNDEVIVPQNVSTWSEMLKLVKKQAKNKVTLDLCLVISVDLFFCRQCWQARGGSKWSTFWIPCLQSETNQRYLHTFT